MKQPKQAVPNKDRKAGRKALNSLIGLAGLSVVSCLNINDARAQDLHGGRITLSNPQEEVTESGRRVCIYSNSIYTFTTVTRSQNCPYSKTFDTEDAE